jgi:hypothetical protein
VMYFDAAALESCSEVVVKLNDVRPVHLDFVARGCEAVTGSYEARGCAVRSYVARSAECPIRKKLGQDPEYSQKNHNAEDGQQYLRNDRKSLGDFNQTVMYEVPSQFGKECVQGVFINILRLQLPSEFRSRTTFRCGLYNVIVKKTPRPKPGPVGEIRTAPPSQPSSRRTARRAFPKIGA